jgi:hypothetical protein
METKIAFWQWLAGTGLIMSIGAVITAVMKMILK